MATRSSVSLLVTLGLLSAAAPAASARTPRCLGYEATLVGTEGADKLYGTHKRDVIVSLGGSDVIHGGHRADFICAGPGSDQVRGGNGKDFISGGTNRDSLDGGEGLDLLWGRAGNDELRSGAGADQDSYRYNSDRIYGGSGDDVIEGNPGLNILEGGPGDDVINGHGADLDNCDCESGFEEVLTGGAGHDQLTGGIVSGPLVEGERFDGGPGNDVIDGGDEVVTTDGSSRRDAVYYYDAAHPVVIDLVAETASGEGRDVLRGIEDVTGTAFDDQIRGNDYANDISGGDGTDVLSGMGGADLISSSDATAYGGDGDDDIRLIAGIVDGAAGRDTIHFFFPSVADLVGGEIVNDYGTISTENIEDVYGSDGADVITGTNDMNYIYAGGGADRVFAGDGVDEIYGAGDNDFLDGEGGVDTLHGGDGIDRCENGEVVLFCE